jgi:endonuclease IV
MLLGAHVPTAGGLDRAPARGRDITADAIRLLNDPRFRGVPMVLETPGPLPVWKRELTLLRGLVGRGRGRA